MHNNKQFFTMDENKIREKKNLISTYGYLHKQRHDIKNHIISRETKQGTSSRTALTWRSFSACSMSSASLSLSRPGLNNIEFCHYFINIYAILTKESICKLCMFAILSTQWTQGTTNCVGAVLYFKI